MCLKERVPGTEEREENKMNWWKKIKNWLFRLFVPRKPHFYPPSSKNANDYTAGSREVNLYNLTNRGSDIGSLQ